MLLKCLITCVYSNHCLTLNTQYIYNNELWGPVKDETFSWLQRICLDKQTPHANAEEAHRNLFLTLAMDLSAKMGQEIDLSIDEEEIMEKLK